VVQLQRIVGNLVIIAYLWVTVCALLLTVLRLPVTYPRFAVAYAYGMMAPYQSAGVDQQAMLAEGLREDGTWEEIDLAPYYPVLFGERNVREFYAIHRQINRPSSKINIREEYAKKLLELERKRGHIYSAVRLSWQTWPFANGEFDAAKTPENTDTELMLELKHE
jgi:hypothetical protein